MSPSLARFGPHALRHACATHLLQEGLSLKEIGDHFGHRHPDIDLGNALLTVRHTKFFKSRLVPFSQSLSRIPWVRPRPVRRAPTSERPDTVTMYEVDSFVRAHLLIDHYRTGAKAQAERLTQDPCTRWRERAVLRWRCAVPRGYVNEFDTADFCGSASTTLTASCAGLTIGVGFSLERFALPEEHCPRDASPLLFLAGSLRLLVIGCGRVCGQPWLARRGRILHLVSRRI